MPKPSTSELLRRRIEAREKLVANRKRDALFADLAEARKRNDHHTESQLLAVLQQRYSVQ